MKVRKINADMRLAIKYAAKLETEIADLNRELDALQRRVTLYADKAHGYERCTEYYKAMLKRVEIHLKDVTRTLKQTDDFSIKDEIQEYLGELNGSLMEDAWEIQQESGWSKELEERTEQMEFGF